MFKLYVSGTHAKMCKTPSRPQEHKGLTHGFSLNLQATIFASTSPHPCSRMDSSFGSSPHASGVPLEDFFTFLFPKSTARSGQGKS